MDADYVAQTPSIDANWLARATASGLHAAMRLNVAGLLLAALNLHFALTAVLSPVGYFASGAASLLAAIQLYLLVRIEIDTLLFDSLAMHPNRDHLAALDNALTTLGWASQQSSGRSLESRSRATTRFLPFAGALAGLQLVTTWVFIVMG